MMILFGGVPDCYADLLDKRARTELKDHNFTLKALKPVHGGYEVTPGHCSDLITTLAKYIDERPNALDKGLATVMLLRPWEDDKFGEEFMPLSVYASVKSVDRPEFSMAGNKRVAAGRIGREIANRQIDDLMKTSLSLIASVNAIHAEMKKRNRTPLLLPIQHFGHPALRRLVDDIASNIRSRQDPKQFIETQCREFEKLFPFNRTRSGGQFRNEHGIVFASPGRDLHGDKTVVSGSCGSRCLLTARVRIGGPIERGFHYDCTRDGEAHVGTFSNCHGEIAKYRGKPHLNVFPNDFIR